MASEESGTTSFDPALAVPAAHAIDGGSEQNDEHEWSCEDGRCEGGAIMWGVTAS